MKALICLFLSLSVLFLPFSLHSGIIDNPRELLQSVEALDGLLADTGESQSITREVFGAFLTQVAQEHEIDANNVFRGQIAEKIQEASAYYPELKILGTQVAIFVIYGLLPDNAAKEVIVGIVQMAIGVTILTIANQTTISKAMAGIMIHDGFRRVVETAIQCVDNVWEYYHAPSN